MGPAESSLAFSFMYTRTLIKPAYQAPRIRARSSCQKSACAEALQRCDDLGGSAARYAHGGVDAAMYCHMSWIVCISSRARQLSFSLLP